MNAQTTTVRSGVGPHQLPVVRRARCGLVEAIPLPTTTLLGSALPHVDWSDAYEVLTPSGARRRDPQEWADAA